MENLWEIAFNPTGSGYKDNSGTWATYNGPAVEAPGRVLLLNQWGVPTRSSVCYLSGKISLRQMMSVEM